jgi:hypothetical protein
VNDAENPILPKSTPPPLVVVIPPPVLTGKTSASRKAMAVLLSGFLGLFIVSGLFSILDDACALFAGSHFFTTINGTVTFVTALVAILVYGLMGLTPLVPKRIFLPVLLLMALSFFGTMPVAIYDFGWILPLDLAISAAMVAIGLGLVWWLQRGGKFHWLLVPEKHLGTRAFSGLNLLVFLLVNLLVVLPAALIYAGGCASLAVNHLTDGFVSLRPHGIVMQARKYARDDGKTVVLFPMSHIAESEFYRSVAQTVTSNSVVLMEGVTDTKNLLTNRLSYKRAASSLHLTEQHEGLSLKRGIYVRADVDVQDFSTNTIGMLNLAALVYSEGLDAHTIMLLLQCQPAPDVQQQVLNDVLLKRNAHLLGELNARLPKFDSFIIPWGAMHMVGISREIQKSGFHLVETHDFTAIRFIGHGDDGGAEGIRFPEKGR